MKVVIELLSNEAVTLQNCLVAVAKQSPLAPLAKDLIDKIQKSIVEAEKKEKEKK